MHCRPLVLCMVVIFTAFSAVSAEQKFYVDFDTAKDAFDSGTTIGLPPADEIWDYTAGQRTFILDYLNSHYGGYGMTFFEGPKPVAFADSGITLNKGFGAGSEGVDFRNLDGDDDADINAISLMKFDGTLEPVGGWDSTDVAMATANAIGHEAEHLMGVRHHDKASPLNTGLGGGIFPSDFTPTYPGPAGAVEAGSTFTALHAGGALSFASLTTPKVISQRVIPRLMVADDEGSAFLTPKVGGNIAVDLAQPLPTPAFAAPHPMRDGPTPPFIAGKAAVVTGALTPAATPDAWESDYYEFFGMAGEVWTIEAMSYILPDPSSDDPRYFDNADVGLALLTGTFAPFAPGTLIPYTTPATSAMGADALTDDDDDTGFLGATLFDVVLPYTGTYVVEVFAAGPFVNPLKDGTDGGSYELFLYSAIPAPEPTTVALMGLGGFVLLRRDGTATQSHRG